MLPYYATNVDLCNDSIEDEMMHFLLECKLYEDEREILNVGEIEDDVKSLMLIYDEHICICNTATC